MTFIEKPLSLLFFRRKLDKIENFKKNPIETQKKIFEYIINEAKDTVWGRKYGYDKISTISDFRDSVPIQSYESMEPFFLRVMQGEQNLLWNKKITNFSKSSGTTTGKSKYIPVSKENLFDCHYEAGKAMVAKYIDNSADSRILTSKNISVVGSFTNDAENKDVMVGDVSAILAQNLPFWADIVKTPSKDIGLIPDWNKKIDKIAECVIEQDISSLLGVPSWMSVILRKTIELSGKPLPELWPNLEVYFHGGVSFEPYKEMYKQLIPIPKMKYINVYNASEGFFAFQDTLDGDDMLLLLDYQMLFEFIPIDSTDDHYAIGLEDVEVGKNYAMIISNNSGLCRYRIGDTVSFTSVNPFRIKVTGRTTSFINVVGEEVLVNNADKAIAKACSQTNSVLEEYTVAPKFYDDNTVSHEWYIEFVEEPEDLQLFKKILDDTLQQENSDYKAKRYKDMVLKAPIVRIVPKDTFYLWFKNKDKLGGQNKIIRLSENRKLIDEIEKIIIQKNQ